MIDKKKTPKPEYDLSEEDLLEDISQESLNQEIDNIKHSKEKIMNHLMGIYDDVKNMGVDLISVDHYIQIATEALNSYNWEKALNYLNKSIKTMIELADANNPELNVKKIKNVQLEANKWNKLNLEIYNIGNVHAKNVQLNFNGKFDVRGDNNIPNIQANGTKEIQIEIFPKNKGASPVEIDLTCEKPFDDTKFDFCSRIWIQAGDYFKNIKIERHFGYEKGQIKMKLNIINKDPGDIKEINFEPNIDESTLSFDYTEPSYERMNKKLLLGDITSGNKKEIIVYFDPLMCTDTFIGGSISFLDWQKKEKYVLLSPQKVKVHNPALATNENIGLIDLKNIMKSELKYTGSKILNIPSGLDFWKLFNLIKEIIFIRNTRLIREILEDKKDFGEAWFYGISEELVNKFVIKIKIHEDIKVLEISILSSNNAALTGLITDLLRELNQTLQKKGFIEQPLSQLENKYLKENVILKKESLLDSQIDKYEEYLDTNFAEQIQKNSIPKQKKHEELAKKERINVSKRRTNWQKD